MGADYLTATEILFVSIVLGLVGHWVIFGILSRLAGRSHTEFDNLLVAYLKSPTRLLAVLLVFLIAEPILKLAPGTATLAHSLFSLITIVAVAWGMISISSAFKAWVESRYDVSESDNLIARQMQTRALVIHRVLAGVIITLSGVAILMVFPAARTLGAGLLASAGVVGLVGGLAARPLITNLIAGIQLALTEPIRLDDVVIVEGEWGWIEEIHTTYVVVRIWDLRRLILPIAYFIEHPFQNWTYRSADLLGYVHIYVDYTVSVDRFRGELKRILDSSELWDGKVWNLQVTRADEKALQLRALFSAENSGDRWNLMVYVREQLVGYLQQNYPSALPKYRVAWDDKYQEMGGV